MFALTCNIACRHCGILSSPQNHERMTLDFALACIRDATRVSPRISTIAFTGGEPFLFQEELAAMVDLCCDLGFSTRVVTNGFWGKNPRQARALLHRLRLAGLDSLNFSADKYHLEFLEPDVLRSAIALVRELGYVAVVNFVLNEPGDPIDRFCRMYGVPPDEVTLCNEQGFRQHARGGTLPAGMADKIQLSLGRLIGLGRAAEYPEEHYHTPLHSFVYSTCDEVANRPVIYPNGDLHACCCAGGKVEAFRVGNVRERPLPELVSAMRRRSHYRFINTFGPRQLYETLQGRSGRLPILQSNHASICDICVAATQGMAPDEVDRALDHYVMERMLAGSPLPPGRG